MVYRVFGLVPFKFRFQSISRAWQSPPLYTKRKLYFSLAEMFWFICLLCLELYILIHGAILWHKMYKNDQHFFNLFRLLMAILIRICIIVITIETYRYRNVQIIAKLHEFDRIFAQKSQSPINYHRLKRSISVDFFKWMTVCFVANFFLVVAYCLESKTNSRLLLAFYPLLKRALLGSTYTTYVILIRHQIQAMHQVLDSNSLFLQESTFELSIDREDRSELEEFEFRRLIHLWKLFPRIHEIVQLMNGAFKWSISISFFVNVFDICISFFYFFERASGLTQYYNMQAYISVAFMFYYLFYFGLIIHEANSLNTEAGKIVPKIHRLISDGKVSPKLQQFVSNIKWCFTSCNRKSHFRR